MTRTAQDTITPLGGEPSTAHDIILDVTDLVKHYGAVRALDSATFSCRRGEVLALVGENGAGKSTVSKILAGAVRPTSGTILVNGQPFTPGSIAEAREHGVVCAFQELALVPEWTVAENLILPSRHGRGGFSQRTALREAAAILEGLELTHIDPGAPLSSLILADQQLVEIARAIAAEPQVLILDEASSALNPLGVRWLFERIEDLTARGVAIIYVSHRLSELATVADHGVVLRDGDAVGTFTRGSWTEDELVSMMAGRDTQKIFPSPGPIDPTAAPVMDITGLTSAGIHGIDVRLAPGEILGIGGLQGHGQTELLRALYGASPASATSWQVAGKPVRHLNPVRAVAAGLGFVPEDRKTEGLALTLGVGENLLAPWLKPFGAGGPSLERRESGWMSGVLESLSVRTRGPREEAAALSGGNQQKLVFGRWLERDRKVLLLHDPTRGIDVRAKQELYAAMMRLSAEGVAIVWFSTEVEELVHMCHRVAVLYRGTVAAELEGELITPDNVVGAAVGTRSES